jgi:hypothetical protein
MMRQEPYYTQADLVNKEATMPTSELNALAKQIRTSGFLKLKSVYDDEPGYRFYAVTVSGGVDGKQKRVELRHGSAPKAFGDLVHTLQKLAMKHFPTAKKPL